MLHGVCNGGIPGISEMKPVSRFVLGGITCLSLPVMADEPMTVEQMVEARCVVCHQGPDTPPAARLAPSLHSTRDHYLRMYPEREAFVLEMMLWIRSPDERRALMACAVRQFNMMPALPYPEPEIRAMAEYIYDTEFPEPEGYAGHFRAEHGAGGSPGPVSSPSR